MHETFFCQRPKFLAATSNLRVEQNLVHLGRFLHFSQKEVGVTFIQILNQYASFYQVRYFTAKEDLLDDIDVKLVLISIKFYRTVR